MPLSYLSFLADTLEHPLRQYRTVTVFDPERTAIATYWHSDLSSFPTQKSTVIINLNHKDNLPPNPPWHNTTLYLGLASQANEDEDFDPTTVRPTLSWEIWDKWRDIPWTHIVFNEKQVFRLPWPKPQSTFDEVEARFRKGYAVIYVGTDPTPNAEEREWTKLEEETPPEEVMVEKQTARTMAKGKWKVGVRREIPPHKMPVRRGHWEPRTLVSDLKALKLLKSLLTDEALFEKAGRLSGMHFDLRDLAREKTVSEHDVKESKAPPPRERPVTRPEIGPEKLAERKTKRVTGKDSSTPHVWREMERLEKMQMEREEIAGGDGTIEELGINSVAGGELREEECKRREEALDVKDSGQGSSLDSGAVVPTSQRGAEGEAAGREGDIEETWKGEEEEEEEAETGVGDSESSHLLRLNFS